jgi:hypothetical protein
MLIDVLWQDRFIQEKAAKYHDKKRTQQESISMKIFGTLYKSEVHNIEKYQYRYEN